MAPRKCAAGQRLKTRPRGEKLSGPGSTTQANLDKVAAHSGASERVYEGQWAGPTRDSWPRGDCVGLIFRHDESVFAEISTAMGMGHKERSNRSDGMGTGEGAGRRFLFHKDPRRFDLATREITNLVAHRFSRAQGPWASNQSRLECSVNNR